MPGPQSIEVFDDPDEADVVLETLTESKRISIDCEPGPVPAWSEEGKRLTLASGTSGAQPMSVVEGVFTIADEQGLVDAPRMLKVLMEDEEIEKQAFGAVYVIREFVLQPEYFQATAPNNVVCLRRMAEAAYPQLADPSLAALPHNGFVAELGNLVGVRYTSHDASGRNFRTRELNKAALDLLVRQTWFLHCVGDTVREKLVERFGRRVDALEPKMGRLSRLFVRNQIDEKFRYDAAEIREELLRRGRL
ncbi:hypothetical protein JCM10213_000496 [Rhodosporidiobolus nylandii]